MVPCVGKFRAGQSELVSDRAKIYGVFKERFLNGQPAEREAVVGFGPYWPEMEAAWQSALHKAAEWIGKAPLPPL